MVMNEFRKGLRKGFISLACALDAADEIERLEAERDALRAQLDKACEALAPFAGAASSYDPDEGDGKNVAWAHDFTIGSLRRARFVLKMIKGGGDE